MTPTDIDPKQLEFVVDLIQRIFMLVLFAGLGLFVYIGYATKSERLYRNPEAPIGFFSLLWQFTTNGAQIAYGLFFLVVGSVMLGLPDAMIEASKSSGGAVYDKEGLLVMGSVTTVIGAVSLLSMFHFFRKPFRFIFEDFNPERLIHKLGLVLLFSVMVFQLFYMYQFQKDPYGLIDALKGKNLLLEAGFQAFLFLVFALLALGVGLARSWSKALERLGLWPIKITSTQWLILMGIALGLVVINKIIEPLLLPSIDPLVIKSMEVFTASLFENQSHLQIIVGAVVLGVFAGFGEELLFRGLLQPVFGIVAVNLIFALMHVQYGISPILLLLFGVGLVFGFVRKKYGTVAAMAVHAFYNAATIIVSVLLSSIHS